MSQQFALERLSELLPERLPDLGPRYLETPLEIPSTRFPAEPWNTATATLFGVIVLFWLVRLWGKYRQHTFILACVGILAIGAVGGTLYHATRASAVFFLLDVVPIGVLVFVGSIYLWVRMWSMWYYIYVVLAACFVILPGRMLGLPSQWAVNISYAAQAVMILIPLGFVQWRTNFLHFGWVLTALVSFLVAWFCRIAEGVLNPPPFPMGTHWLWHTFGATATACLMEYYYRIEGVSLTRKPDDAAAEARI